MSVPVVYLDSSAIVKRYIMEKGSDTVSEIFRRAYSGEEVISFSIWNIGEVLGALDRAVRIGRLDLSKYRIARNRFLREVKRMSKLGILMVVPIKQKILTDSWRIVERHHVYVADALQVATAKRVGANLFLTGDKRLHEIAVHEGLESRLLG